MTKTKNNRSSNRGGGEINLEPDQQSHNASLSQAVKDFRKAYPTLQSDIQAEKVIRDIMSAITAGVDLEISASITWIDQRLKDIQQAEKDPSSRDRLIRHATFFDPEYRSIKEQITAKRKRIAESIVAINRKQEEIAQEAILQADHLAEKCDGKPPKKRLLDNGWAYLSLFGLLGGAEMITNYQNLQAIPEGLTNGAVLPFTVALTSIMLLGSHYTGSAICEKNKPLALVAGSIAVGAIAFTGIIRVQIDGGILMTAFNILLGTTGAFIAYLRQYHRDYFKSVDDKRRLENQTAVGLAENMATEVECDEEEKALEEGILDKAQNAQPELTQSKASLENYRFGFHQKVQATKADELNRYRQSKNVTSKVLNSFGSEVLNRLFKTNKNDTR